VEERIEKEKTSLQNQQLTEGKIYRPQ
jgi:hypothetical protein